MRPVDQRTPDDCLMSCLASILEVSHDDLPALGPEHNDGSWYDVLQAAVRGHGWELVYTENAPVAFRPWGYHIAGGPSPRCCKGGHAVVCLDGEIVHDPHPSRAGIPSIEQWYLLFPGASAGLGRLDPCARCGHRREAHGAEGHPCTDCSYHGLTGACWGWTEASDPARVAEEVFVVLRDVERACARMGFREDGPARLLRTHEGTVLYDIVRSGRLRRLRRLVKSLWPRRFDGTEREQ